MRNKILFLSLIVGLSALSFITFQSCESIEVDNNTNETNLINIQCKAPGVVGEDYKLNIPEPYCEVGKLHNMGLEYIYNKIEQEAIAYLKDGKLEYKKESLSDYNDLIRNATYEFCKQNQMLVEGDSKTNYDDFINMMFPRYENSGFLLDSTIIDEIDGKLTEEQSSLLTQVNNVFEENNVNDESAIKSQLEAIVETASLELDEDEAPVIYCAVSVAYNSYKYWTANYKKWDFVINFPEILENYQNQDLNDMQIADNELMVQGPQRVASGTSSDDGVSWWSKTYDSVEDFYNLAADDVDHWWNEEGGKETVTADGAGAVYGALEGAVTFQALVIVTNAARVGLLASAGIQAVSLF